MIIYKSINYFFKPKINFTVESFVASITVINSGSKTGKERTGYNVPFVFAFATIPARIVDETESEIVPKKRVKKKIE